jgi:Icc-related predicted phosphoesterase
VRINEYFVDYLVRGGSLKREYILEVNGNNHYTIGEKLKGGNVLRNLIVNEYAPLRILHIHDLVASKGNRNKMAYIDSLFA